MLLTRLVERVDVSPGDGAIDDGVTALAWVELANRVRSAAAVLSADGVRPGDRIALSGQPVGTLVWFLAADWCGASALVADPDWTAAEWRAVRAAAAPTWEIDADRIPSTATIGTSPMVGDDAFFYLGTTSGSTGGPKVYTRTRKSWHESVGFFTDAGEISDADTVLIPRPLSTSGTMFAAYHAIWVGARSVVLPRWSARQAVRRSTEATVAYVIPAMLAGMVAEWEAEPELLARCQLRVIFSGGAKLPPELTDRVRRLLPTCRVIEYYGSSEHSLIAMRAAGGGPSVGFPASTVDIQIRDTAGEEVPDGNEGELWVRSPMVFSGYLRSGRLMERETDWVSVGDRGCRTENGEVVVLGRGAATIVTGGAKVVAEQVEAVLRTAGGVAEAVVVGLPHARFGSIVAAVVQPESGVRLELPALRRLVAAELGPNLRPRRWLTMSAIPMTATGKVARAAVRDGLAAGTLPVVPL